MGMRFAELGQVVPQSASQEQPGELGEEEMGKMGTSVKRQKKKIYLYDY